MAPRQHRLAAQAVPPFCVGFTRSPKGAPDPLLQVVNDLYRRGLTDARTWEQVKITWEQQKDRLLPSFAEFVGKLSEKAAKLVPGVCEMFGVAIKESLDGLVAVSEDLKTGSMSLSRLEYPQAQELVSAVHQCAGRSIAVFMDQWEETDNLVAQANTFRDFLREPEQWPACHFFLGVREGSDAAAVLGRIETRISWARLYLHLGEMDLSAAAERRRLVSFLRSRVPGIWNVDDDSVLRLVGGYPRVIGRWLDDDAHDAARTLDGLRRLVQESLEFRYSDLDALLLALNSDSLKLIVRIALVPLVEDSDAWASLRPIVIGDLDPNLLDDLKLGNVLANDLEPPGFGHPTRREAARSLARVRTYLQKPGAPVDIFAERRNVTHPLRLRRET